ncbi:MAG TPA: carboxypeptidase-like regulatory domain-containing protein [Labilithrix sp.]|jgi:tetratricopeptide (TPR) repeat protein
MRPWPAFVVLAACASAPPPPHDAPAPKPSASANANANAIEAKKHYDEGLKLFADKAFPEALTAFAEAYRLGNDPEALRHAALTQRHLKHPAAAYDDYEQLLAKHDAQLSDATRREAQKAIEELGEITGTLLVVVSEPDADIEIDGRPAGKSPMAKPRRVRASDHHTIKVTKAGFALFEQSGVEIVGREDKKLEVKLGADASGGSASMNDAEKKATARVAFTDGVALQDKGDCASALTKFETAERLHDAPTHLLHIAECQASTGKLVEAQETYETLAHMTLDKAAPDAFRQAQDQGKKELTAEKARVPTLAIKVTPANAPGLVVQVNGARLANDLVGLARPTNPGTYKLTATATGYKTANADVPVVEGEKRSIELRLAR